MQILELDVSNKRAYKYVQIYRQNETGVTITVRLYENGVSQYGGLNNIKLSLFFPFNNYEIQAVNGNAKTQTYQFKIPTDVLKNNVGDAERAYVHYTTPEGNVRSTGDFIFKIVSQGDISAGQGSTYIGRLEELIKQFNNRFDSYMKTIQDNTAQIQYQVDQLKVQAGKIETELNKLNLPVWEARITKMVNDKITQMQQMIDKFNSENLALKNKVTALETELHTPIKFHGVYSGGKSVPNAKNNTKLNVGDLLYGADTTTGRKMNSSPITKSADNAYNVTRNCKVRIVVNATMHCSGLGTTGQYVYLTSYSSNNMNSSTQRVNGTGVGATEGLSYQNVIVLDFVTDLKVGEELNFTPALDSGKSLKNAWINSIEIQEI